MDTYSRALLARDSVCPLLSNFLHEWSASSYLAPHQWQPPTPHRLETGSRAQRIKMENTDWTKRTFFFSKLGKMQKLKIGFVDDCVIDMDQVILLTSRCAGGKKNMSREWKLCIKVQRLWSHLIKSSAYLIKTVAEIPSELFYCVRRKIYGSI